ncbi:hypothetical protein H6G74_04335 [Nostoc spongiaeforme FACHB-130]|uniref:Cytochrome oxidase subunit II transmembrane region profile domain-containing protein n=1 Tax=Nostoc spongiaeforme FACHB-130 TaxID=1357510 RepID=A0ABR8FQ74_9NOSO|nr:hypothetical protein [Nostoc spongiaeforme FACHB-130]
MNIRNILSLSAIALTSTVVSLGIGRIAYYWLPTQATAESRLIDDVISFLISIGSFIFLGVIGVLIYSLVLHRADNFDITDGSPIDGNITLEIIWTAIPIFLVFWIAGYSYQIYEGMGIQGKETFTQSHILTDEQVTENTTQNQDAATNKHDV